CDKEIRTPEALNVPLPADNLTLNTLAKKLAADLPRKTFGPTTQEAARRWGIDTMGRVFGVIDVPADVLVPGPVLKTVDQGETRAEYRVLKVGALSVPVVTLTRGKPKGTVVVVADG